MLGEVVESRSVAAFFDMAATAWDEGRRADDHKIETILDLADVRQGHRVLDVACGTGFLFPYYLSRGVGRVTGVDISAGMLAVARAKHRDERIELVEGDVMEAGLGGPYDRLVVFNALPHFPCPRRLAERLAFLSGPDSRLTFAHDMGRSRLNAHHGRRAPGVSRELICERELAAFLSSFYDVDVLRGEDDLYLVSGTRRL